MPTVQSKYARKRAPKLTQYEVPLYREVVLTAAEVIASNSSYPTIVPAPGAGKAIMYLDGFLNVFGGSTDYDQDGDTALHYTDNTGIQVSAITDDFFNDATAGDVIRLVPQGAQEAEATGNEKTEIGMTANAPLVLVSTASPYNAAGDRLCKVGVWYRIIDVLT